MSEKEFEFVQNVSAASRYTPFPIEFFRILNVTKKFPV